MDSSEPLFTSFEITLVSKVELVHFSFDTRTMFVMSLIRV